MRAVDSDQCLDMDDSDADGFEVIPGRNAAVLTCPRVHLEDNPMFSAKSLRNPSSGVPNPDTTRH